jgi:O-antigen/teichoic acid export membrane protein
MSSTLGYSASGTKRRLHGQCDGRGAECRDDDTADVLSTLNKLARGAIVNLLARALTMALGLAILVVVARRGPEVQGAFSLFVAVESVLLTLFSGLGIALARRLSHHGESGGAALRSAMLAAFAIGLAAVPILVALSAVSHSPPYDRLWLLAAVAPLILLVPTASGLWLGQGRMLALNAPQVSVPLLMLAGLGAMALGVAPVGIAAVLGVWVVAKAIVAVGTAFAAWRAVPCEPAAWEALRADAGFIVVIGLTNVISFLNYRVTLFIVEREQGLDIAGVYSVAVQVAEFLWLLSSAVTVSAYRRIGEPDRMQAAALTLRTSRINVMATAATAPLLLVAAHWALPAVLGPAYAPALGPLAALLPGVAAYAAASSLSAFFTNHLGRPQWAARIAGLSLALNTAGAFWAVPRFGMLGAAWSTSVSYGIAITVAAAWFLREAGLPWSALVRR